MTSLTEVENEIIHHLQKKVTMNQEVSLAQLANECHVVPSTIVKVAKKMGYSGFVELYYHIRAQQEKHRDSLFFAQDLIEGNLKENMI